MTRLEAIDHFIDMPDKSWWPFPHYSNDWAIYLNVALAVISGGLDDATDEASLRAATLHGDTLVHAEIIHYEEVIREACRADDELMEWGRAIDEQRHRIVESN